MKIKFLICRIGLNSGAWFLFSIGFRYEKYLTRCGNTKLIGFVFGSKYACVQIIKWTKNM